MSRVRTEIEAVLSNGIDFKNRTIDFGDYFETKAEDITEINSLTVGLAVRAIRAMEQEAPNKPINLYMNSGGGDPYSTLYLIDIILSSPCQFKFHGGGSVMSAAIYVLAVCDERYLHEGTTVMCHNGWVSDEGAADDVYINMEENKRLDEQFFQILADNSFMPRTFWADLHRRDLHLNAQECIQLGICDEIIKHKRRGSLRKKRSAHKPNSKSIPHLVKKLYARVGINPKGKELVVRTLVEETDETLVVDNTPAVIKEENDKEKI